MSSDQINIKNIWPYIRGTSRKYGTEDNGGFWGENGYNCIEAGYIELDDSATKIIRVIELIPCADVMTIGDILGQDTLPHISIDCIGDGYLRLFSRLHEALKWESDAVPLSNMQLVEGTPDWEILAQRAAHHE